MSGLPDTLSAAEAARLCGVSERTVRRWVAAGRLTADMSGPSMRVATCDLLPLMSDTSGHHDATDTGPDVRQAATNGYSTPSPDPSPDLSDMVALVRDLNAQLVQKAEAAAMWQARAELLSAELERLRQPALPAGSVQEPAPQPQEPAAERPWWARLLGRRTTPD